MNGLKNLAIGALAAAGVVYAISSLGEYFVSRSQEEPKRERYNTNTVFVDSLFHDGPNFVLSDENGDKGVDLVRRNGHPAEYVFIAPGYQATDCTPEVGARELTPEELELANQMLRGGNEFSYKIAKAQFDAAKKSE